MKYSLGIALSLALAVAGYLLLIAGLLAGADTLVAAVALLAGSIALGVASLAPLGRQVSRHVEEDERVYRVLVESLASLKLRNIEAAVLAEKYDGFPRLPGGWLAPALLPGGSVIAAKKLAELLAEHSKREAEVYGLVYELAKAHGINLPRGRPAVQPGPFGVEQALQAHIAPLENLAQVLVDVVEKLTIEQRPALSADQPAGSTPRASPRPA